MKDLLEKVASDHNVESMGTTAYGMHEQNKVKAALTFVKGMITAEQMIVLKGKGEGDGVEKLVSLKKTCEAVDTQVVNAMVEAFVAAGSKLKPRAAAGNWTILGLHSRMEELKRRKAEAGADKTKKTKSEAAGSMFTWAKGKK